MRGKRGKGDDDGGCGDGGEEEEEEEEEEEKEEGMYRYIIRVIYHLINVMI